MVRLSTEATAEAGGDDGTVGDMAPVASLVRALGAARRQLLATGAAGGTDTSRRDTTRGSHGCMMQLVLLSTVNHTATHVTEETH